MQRLNPKDPISLYVALIATSGAVFLSDLATPLGIAVWVFYLAPMSITLLSWRPMLPLVAAPVLTILTGFGYFFGPVGIDPSIAQLNRSFGIATIWFLGASSWFFIRGKLAVRRQEWLQAGQTLLNEKMAGELTVDQLGQNVLRTLAEYCGALAGTMFVQENGFFDRAASYALPDSAEVPKRVSPGEGLIGQAVQDGRSFVVDSVPSGYLRVGSGLGNVAPAHIVIAPALVDGRANAVLEFAFLHNVNEAVLELLNRVSTSVALTVRSVKFRIRLEELLEETQRQAEELQSQAEELRVTNEQIESQSRALQGSQVRLEQQQVELEQTNANLEEQAQALEAQNEELKHAKTLLELQATELEQASRYKSDFLASMSHELRTPLNSALILARLLYENRTGNLTDEQVAYARSIESSGNSLLDLINDVLDLAKVEAGRMDLRTQHVNLDRLGESLRSMFHPIATQKGLALEIVVEPGPTASVESDQQRLEQVLKNLLSNAIKFTDAGVVTLTISRLAGRRFSFAVHDTGIGIPEEQLQSIFEPFRQLEGAIDRRYGGTGLGLSISRELVRLLGGELQVRSRVGEGSTFTVILPEAAQADHAQQPLVRRASASTAEKSVTAPPAPPPTITPHGRVADDRQSLKPEDRAVLVVEDDDLFAQILRDLAHELGFRCLVATSAAEALALVHGQVSPSAVVLDVGLPDNSGLALLDRFKTDARTRHIPVHMVSVDDYAETALSLGAVGYVLKPAKREQLIEVFQRLEDRIARKVRRILLVEDDDLQRQSLTALLASNNVETVAASTGAECLEQLRAASFDCMVLDLTLPDTNGLALLDTISREDRYSFPPVIVYTGRQLSIDEEQALRRYSQSIVIKGAKSPERLLDEVSLFLHQVVSEMPPEKRRLLEQARSRDAVLEGRRVLLVEDDVRNIFALTSLLEPRGVQLQIARNGLEALRMLESGSSQPPVDLILMDIMMPEMDGLTATREIRKRAGWNRIPIIALTAKAMRGDQEQVLAAGANDYMAKPLDVDQLLSAMRVWMPR